VALLIDATLPKTGSGLTLWLLESGCLKLLGAHRALVFFVGMGLMNVGKTMNTLQICLLGKLWVARHYVLLQIFCLTECLFTVITHKIILLHLFLSLCHMFLVLFMSFHPGELWVVITICNGKAERRLKTIPSASVK
uniref:Uncharacterized protein n=1 Tax=Chelydra serpentina TaxID=8475 RepID=A0A8C3TFN9_CHESE